MALFSLYFSSMPKNIHFDVNDLNNFMTYGVYFQGCGDIYIGKGTYIAPNVGLITENHDLYDPRKRAGAKTLVIGENCWFGMNAILLLGVVLGPHTVVGAGAVVTKSFSAGFCVLAGNPAKIFKLLDNGKFV